MRREVNSVPFGHKDEQDGVVKGTLIYMDSFDDTTEADLQELIAFAEQRNFAKVVLFPHNEKTLRSMKITDVQAFHKRVKNLQSMLEEIAPSLPVTIDRWEEKRVKYTPMEASLRFLMDKYKAPHFLYLTDRFANAFASFASFEELIRKVRLVIRMKSDSVPHPKLTQYDSRWEAIE